MSKLKGCFLSKSPHWRTPVKLLQDLNKEFGFLYDPCPSYSSVDGLKITWGDSSFVNPPYGRETIKWCKKAVDEYKKGKLIVLLLAARTDTKWFHEYILPYAKEIRFIRGRLRFNDQKGSAPFPSMIVIFK